MQWQERRKTAHLTKCINDLKLMEFLVWKSIQKDKKTVFSTLLAFLLDLRDNCALVIGIHSQWYYFRIKLFFLLFILQQKLVLGFKEINSVLNRYVNWQVLNQSAEYLSSFRSFHWLLEKSVICNLALLLCKKILLKVSAVLTNILSMT